MPVKIKITKGRLKKIVRNTGLNFISGAKVLMDRKVLSEMKKGRSPVKNGRWDKPYSDSYQKQIKGSLFKGIGKKLSPINLKVSGQLYSSFRTIKRGFSLLMEFTDFTAIFHDKKGAGKARAIRRMLPRGKEEFNTEIDNQLTKVLKNSLRKAIKQSK